MINLLIIVEWAVFTLGSITLPDKKLRSNNHHLLWVGRLINILVYFCWDILTGSKDTVPWKSDVSFLFEYMFSIRYPMGQLYTTGMKWDWQLEAGRIVTGSATLVGTDKLTKTLAGWNPLREWIIINFSCFFKINHGLSHLYLSTLLPPHVGGL